MRPGGQVAGVQPGRQGLDAAAVEQDVSCSVWWSLSILPVVMGDLGLVSRWVMPFSRQIRSNSTSAGRGLPDRPVNCLPLSVRTSRGIPYSAMAAVNARQTARDGAGPTGDAPLAGRKSPPRPRH
jgi:hypothetical protein